MTVTVEETLRLFDIHCAALFQKEQLTTFKVNVCSVQLNVSMYSTLTAFKCHRL